MSQSIAAPGAGGRNILLRIKRREGPDHAARWEEFSVPRRAMMSVANCLQWIEAHPPSIDGNTIPPPAYQAPCSDESCGACAMNINGKARPACSTLVDKLAEGDTPISVEPLAKFPVIRDLIVDRARFLADLQRVKAWVPIDGCYDLGAEPESQPRQETRYALSRCIACGCCMEACPQYTPANKFVGAAVINQARLFNEHPIGVQLKGERLEALMREGGVADCGKSGNCVEVCPKQIPLLESIAAVQRQVSVHVVKKFFSA